MRKLVYAIITLWVISMVSYFTIAYGGDITRSYDFTDGEVLTAAELDGSFDELVQELNDLDGENLASDISITTSGNFVGTGNFSATGGTNVIGDGGTDTLTLDVPGGFTFPSTMTWTFSNSQTVSGTWADLGDISTLDVEGGTWDNGTLTNVAHVSGTLSQMDVAGDLTWSSTQDLDNSAWTGVNIDDGTIDDVTLGGATLTGALWYNDASDDLEVMGDVGTAGSFLMSQGLAVPTWGAATNIEMFTTPGANTFTTDAQTNYIFAYLVAGGGGGGSGQNGGAHGSGGGGGGGSIAFGWFKVSPSTGYALSIGAGGAKGVDGTWTDGSDGGDTTLTLDNGHVITAEKGLGGKKGTDSAGGGDGGLGGTPAGSDGDGSGGTGGGPLTGWVKDGGDGGDGGVANTPGGGGGGSLFEGPDGTGDQPGTNATDGTGAGGSGGSGDIAGNDGADGGDGLGVIFY